MNELVDKSGLSYFWSKIKSQLDVAETAIADIYLILRKQKQNNDWLEL